MYSIQLEGLRWWMIIGQVTIELDVVLVELDRVQLTALQVVVAMQHRRAAVGTRQRYIEFDYLQPQRFCRQDKERMRVGRRRRGIERKRK